MKNKYILESSADGITWKRRASFTEGDPSRFGEPFSPEIAIREAQVFKQHWAPQNRSYDSEVQRAIHNRKYVRIIIEI